MNSGRSFILAIDPGTHKSGLAVLDNTGTIIFRKIITLENLPVEIKNLAGKFFLKNIVVGRGTGWQRVLAQMTEPPAPVIPVEEKHSTDRARRLYWQINPPRGIKKFIPRGLLVPPEPLDDLAAVIIGRQYLAGANR